jgi:hypothetical protein
LPARKKNGTDDRQREHHQKERVLHTAGVLPNERHRDDTERVQDRERPSALNRVPGRAPGHGREADVDSPKSQQSDRGGGKVDVQPTNEPGQHDRRQEGEYRQ